MGQALCTKIFREVTGSIYEKALEAPVKLDWCTATQF